MWVKSIPIFRTCKLAGRLSNGWLNSEERER